MASLGNLTKLESLDMNGCRGDPEELEEQVWTAIRAKRKELAKATRTADELEAEARALMEKAEELRRAAEALLERAREMRGAE